jgi:RES domain-containing protein
VGLHDLWIGALRAGGRWHTRPIGAAFAVVYTAGTRALAQLEKRVHCNGVEPVDQALLRLEIADGATLLEAASSGLKRNWRSDEAYTQSFGDAWFTKRSSLGLWVPSYVSPRDSNLLLNPTHPQYDSHVTVIVEEPQFRFDPRLF